MILPHQELKLLVPNSKYYGPCSADLTLGNEFKIMTASDSRGNRVFKNGSIDFKDVDVSYVHHVASKTKGFELPPYSFALATTQESIYVPITMAAYVEGRSSVGRLGLQVQNASYIDSGFEGQITLELANQTGHYLTIYPEMRVCQIVFIKLTEATESPYKGRYQKQSGPTASRLND